MSILSKAKLALANLVKLNAAETKVKLASFAGADGTMYWSPQEELGENAEVYIESEDGTLSAVPDGAITIEGVTYTVANSVITGIQEAAAELAEELPPAAEAAVEGAADVIEELIQELEVAKEELVMAKAENEKLKVELRKAKKTSNGQLIDTKLVSEEQKKKNPLAAYGLSI